MDTSVEAAPSTIPMKIIKELDRLCSVSTQLAIDMDERLGLILAMPEDEQDEGKSPPHEPYPPLFNDIRSYLETLDTTCIRIRNILDRVVL